MRRWFSPAHISAGLVAILVGYTSSAAIIFQALQSLGADQAITDSWFLVLGLGMGVTCISLSLYYRQPILTAWSTPGAALMVTGLGDMPIEAAVGAFLFSSLLMVLVGISGLFDKLIKLIPNPIAAALLAGVLLPFALQALASVETNLVLGLAMLVTYVISLRFIPRYGVLITLTIGVLVALQQHQGLFDNLQFKLAMPVWITPSFEGSAIISLGIPLFVVTMASQNLPGIAALRANGYQAPASPLIGWTGLTGMISAAFGGFAYNLAAITAAICMTKEVDPDPNQRYRAAVWAGIFYIMIGLFASSITSLFFALPKALIYIIAGLALLGTIANSLQSAMHDEKQRLAALVTFITTASGVVIGGIGSAFWGLVCGLLLHWLLSHKQ